LPDTLPAAVRAFLREHIETYEQLELLLLLRQQPLEAWSTRRLAERRSYPLDLVEEALEGLARARTVERVPSTGEVRYAPLDSVQRATIDDLASAYERNPLAIIKLMSANSIERVRTAAILTFAEAFVIGRKKDG
jgi:hypothetical protein